MYIIYKKDTGKISHTVNGKFYPEYLPETDGYIELTDSEQISNFSTLTHYVENGELKIAEDRPSEDYTYNPEEHTWTRFRAEINHERVARTQRTQLLSDCDWIVTKYTERGEPVPEAWVTYRQALRDITDQEGFPENIEWPEKPQ
jgi:hypothetical protein